MRKKLRNYGPACRVSISSLCVSTLSTIEQLKSPELKNNSAADLSRYSDHGATVRHCLYLLGPRPVPSTCRARSHSQVSAIIGPSGLIRFIPADLANVGPLRREYNFAPSTMIALYPFFIGGAGGPNGSGGRPPARLLPVRPGPTNGGGSE